MNSTPGMMHVTLPASVIKEKHESLLDFAKSGFLTDFTVKVKVCFDVDFMETIAVNKAILGNSSPYFLRHFLENPNLNEVEIIGFKMANVAKVFDFLYTNEISIDTEDFLEILKLAKLLELDNFLKAVFENLENSVNIDNALRVRDMCVWMDQVAGIKFCENFIKENFDNISNTADFKRMNHRYLLELLKSDDLVVSDEKTLYEIIMGWINVAEIERKNHAKELLYHIRFPMMPEEFLVEIQYHSIIDDDQKLIRMLRDTLYYHRNGKFKQGDRDVLTNEHRTVRKYRSIPITSASSKEFCNHLLCIGGSGDDSDDLLNSIEISSDGGKTWSEYFKINPGRNNFSADIWGDFIILIGGNGPKFSCSKFDIKNKVHSKLCRLPDKRIRHASSIIGNKVYVAGGEEKYTRDSLISLDLSNDSSWEEKASMHYERNGPAMCSVDGHLFCFGGEATNTCECYDPVANRWTNLPPMKEVRFTPVCCYDNKKFIYIAGGTNLYGDFISSIEKFSVRTTQWTIVNAPLNVDLDGFTLTHSGDDIFCIGGHDEDYNAQSAVEKLKIDQFGFRWITVGHLLQERSFHCTVNYRT